MKNAAVALLPLLAMGCMAEHEYAPYDAELEPYLLAEVFGDVGDLRNIENRFSAQPELFAFPMQRDAYVDRYDNELYANMVVEHPDGRVYLDVSVYNVDQMEEGRDYTVALDNGYTSEGAYTYTDGDADPGEGPGVYVYACPETNSGADPGSASGEAEEITMRLERPVTGARPRLVFDAQADNDQQQVFLDGWITAEPDARPSI